MQDSKQIDELFRLMDRVRKAWQSVTPCEHLSKSQFGTLMAIAHHGRMPGQSCTPSQEHGALTSPRRGAL